MTGLIAFQASGHTREHSQCHLVDEEVAGRLYLLWIVDGMIEPHMSHSTTSTTTQIISKYSRAYSTNPSGSQNPDGEWQHFSNPVLKVVLDVKRSEAEGRLGSFRLRVLWSMSVEGDSMDVDQREFVFVGCVSIARGQESDRLHTFRKT
jgi:hypothetical protein